MLFSENLDSRAISRINSNETLHETFHFEDADAKTTTSYQTSISFDGSQDLKFKNHSIGSNKIPSSLIPMNEEDKIRLEYVLFRQALREVGLDGCYKDI